jgi:hypothetical protein
MVHHWAICEGRDTGVCFVSKVEVATYAGLSFGFRKVRGVTVDFQLHVGGILFDGGTRSGAAVI